MRFRLRAPIKNNARRLDQFGKKKFSRQQTPEKPETPAPVAEKIEPPAIICPICMDETTNSVVVHPCLHEYCLDCINLWIGRRRNTCPMCRQIMVEFRINSTGEVKKVPSISFWACLGRCVVAGLVSILHVVMFYRYFLRDDGGRTPATPNVQASHT